MRTLLKFVPVVLVALAFSVPAQARAHRVHHHHFVAHAASKGRYYTAWRRVPTKVVWASRRYYAQWECTIGGTVLAAGITFVGLTSPWAIAGILAGGSFTAGCEVGYPHRSSYFSVGVPWSKNSDCWVVFPHGSKRRHFTECFA